MPKLEAVKIEMSDAEYQELEQLLRRTSTPQQIALRAKIILRAAGRMLLNIISPQKDCGLSPMSRLPIELSLLWMN